MKRKGVRVRRVVRRIELWPVAKIGLLFHLVCFGLSLGVAVVVWQAARRAGVLDDLAKFLGDLGVVDDAKKDIQFHGDAVFRGALYAGAVLVVVNTLATVLLAFFYNLLAGIFGGIVVSFLEDPTRLVTARAHSDAAAPTSSQRRMRNRSAPRLRPIGRGRRGRDPLGPTTEVASGEAIGPDNDTMAWAPDRPARPVRRSRRDRSGSPPGPPSTSPAPTAQVMEPVNGTPPTTGDDWGDVADSEWQGTAVDRDLGVATATGAGSLDESDKHQVSTAPSWATQTPWDV